ncbi:HK97 family phage prohead protease [Burkholderia anthina]|uniref:HK97 family phage prohead protease n=1 Tax=Burkholderia anthina TaxID=179879 RepID=UPI001FB80092|nr:HK97 family phage prohead protease [Burkholderia anthina]
MKATAKGLEFTAQIAKSDPNLPEVDRAWSQIKAGLVRSVSIGFIPLKGKPNNAGGMTYDETDIFELSLTPTPMNADAVITSHKSVGDAGRVAPTQIAARIAALVASTKPQEKTPSMSQKTITRSAIQQQIIKAVSSQWPAGAIMKDGPVSATTDNTPSLYYPSQAAGVLLPPTTQSLITVLSQGGAANLPPNTRLLTQSALLTAADVSQGERVPAAAPDIEFSLTTTTRKFALIVAFTSEMLAASNFDNSVEQYVEQQLTDAANLAADNFFIGLMDAQGIVATAGAGASYAEVLSPFVGDLRSAMWVAHPLTFVGLQDAANPNLGASGGVFKNIAAVPSMAAPVGKLYLVDRKRVAVHDGATFVEVSDEATIIMDSAPDSTMTPVNLFEKNWRALKITKYADAKLLSAPLVITLQ